RRQPHCHTRAGARACHRRSLDRWCPPSPSPSPPRPPPRSTLFPYTTLFRSARTRFPSACRSRRFRAALERRVRGFQNWEEESGRSEEHTSELQSPDHLVCRLLLEKKKINDTTIMMATVLHDNRLRTARRGRL